MLINLMMILLFFFTFFKYNLFMLMYMCMYLFMWMFFMNNNYYILMYDFMYKDMMSFSMINLTMLIIMMMIVSMNYNYNVNLDKKMNYNLFLIYLLMMSLYFSFSVNSMMSFYFLFEFSLIPLLMMIILMGPSMERSKASMYLIIYTLAGSFPFLVIMIKNMMYHMYFNINIFIKNINYSYLWLIMFLMFFIKLPLFFLHFWLPKAHVEASVEGSMILASVMLKLGGFGIYRLIFFFFIKNIFFFKCFLISLSLISCLIVSFICMRQMDIKLLIAYSSISHMMLCLSCLMIFLKFSIIGVTGMMLSHGLCSSCLFFLGNIFYKNYKTRSLIFLKSSFNTSYLMYMWMLFSLINMGLPPFMNFFSEIILILIILKYFLMNLMILMLFLIMTVMYNLNMFLQVSHGNFWIKKFSNKEKFMEKMVITSHLIFLIIYMFNMNMFFEVIY